MVGGAGAAHVAWVGVGQLRKHQQRAEQSEGWLTPLTPAWDGKRDNSSSAGAGEIIKKDGKASLHPSLSHTTERKDQKPFLAASKLY